MKLLVDKITRKQLDAFLQKHATDKKVLDIGSGGSSYDRFFPHRLTVDIDPERKPDVVADGEHLPFADGEFEVVLCTEVLEHTPNPQQLINELYRVTRPGGTVLLTTRFVYPIHDAPGDYWRFTEYGLRLLFKKWQQLELEAEVGTATTIAVLLQRIGFQTKLRLNKLTKLSLFVSALLLSKLDFMVTKEFGNIKQTQVVPQIMTSGYYVCAKK